MPILRNPSKDRFTVVHNALIEDDRLSPDALGLAVYLFSKPNDWQVIPAEIAAKFGIGRDKVRKLQRQLEECGYMVLRSRRSADGKVSGREWVLVEPGADPNDPNADMFAGDKPPKDRKPEFQAVGTESLKNRNSEKTEIRKIRPLLNTDTTTKDSIAAPDGTAQERGARKRDPVFEALCEIQGSNTAELTRSMAGAIGTAKKQIAEAWEAGGHSAEELPAEIRRRARVLQKRYPEIHVTATALAKHWSTLGEPPQRTNGAGESAADRDRREFQKAVSDARGTLRLLGDPEHLQPPDDASRRDMLAWIERVNTAWDEHTKQLRGETP